MSELAVAALRMGLLLVMWILIISIVSSQGRDLMVGARNKVRSRNGAGTPAAAGAGGGTSAAAGAGGGTSAAPTGSSTAPSAPGGPAAAPAAARPLATRLAITEGPLKDTVIQLNGTPLLLGRAEDADLVLEDDYVSGRHARLFPQGSRWFLEDLGSTNGTFVSGNPLSRTVAVEPGTPIRIGKTVLELRS